MAVSLLAFVKRHDVRPATGQGAQTRKQAQRRTIESLKLARAFRLGAARAPTENLNDSIGKHCDTYGVEPI